MRRFFLSAILLLVVFSQSAFAQKPAKASDFTLTDCSGANYNLYSQIDNGKIVIMEFIMGCLPCVMGHQAIESIQHSFDVSNPGMVQNLTLGYSSGTDCSTMQSWMSDNNFIGACFAGDMGVINHYNGSLGMPTICIVGGADHKILYWKMGFSKKDTTEMITAISDALNQASVKSSSSTESVAVYPNPSSSNLTIRLSCLTTAERQIELYSAAGVKIESVFTGVLASGEQSIPVSSTALSNGSYYITVTTGGNSLTIPFTVVH